MDQEELQIATRVCLTVISSITVFSLVCLGGCHETESTDRAAIAAGLVQKQDVGNSSHYWGKP